ncbi:MAG: hypothetical protein QOG52_2217 [Frankiaceae bacterium]|nr:hypothetical protein [Frankiaceae bacterium]
MSPTREREIIAAFVSLATSLADGDDVVELLTGLTTDCVRLLDVTAAGLLLADTNGVLHLVAASSEEATTLELFQLQRAEGPCLDCYHSGDAVSAPDLSDTTHRWPHFALAAERAGYASVHAVPLRLRDRVLGALNLFGAEAGPLGTADLELAQALAHVASVALVQEKAAADKDLIVSQLNTALTSRIVLEQAKGVLAHRGDLDMEEAFAVLRGYARDCNERLTDVAGAIVARTLSPNVILEHAAERAHRRTPRQSPKP